MDFWELIFPRSLKDPFYYYYLFIQPQQFLLKRKLVLLDMFGSQTMSRMNFSDPLTFPFFNELLPRRP